MKAKKAVKMFLPVLGVLTLTGCNEIFPFIGQDQVRTIAGEVSRVEDDSVFIQTGSWKETEGEEETSELELTGEEQEIRITKDTVIRLQEEDEKKDDEENPEEGKPDTEAEEVPEGEEPDTEAEGDPEGEAPDMEAEGAPEEEGPDAEAEEVPEEPADQALSVSDLREGDVISVSLDKKDEPLEIVIISRGRPDLVGKLRESEDYDAATEIAVDIETDGEAYTSTGTDENAVHVFGDARAVLKNAEIIRTSRDSTGGSSASLYGIGAALLTTDGISYIRDSTITTNAPGGIGIFSYGNGISYAMNTAVTTRQDTSGGIQTASGGILYGWNLDVETNGVSSPAIKSDGGGGSIVLDGGSYRSTGTDSPAVYCMSDMAFRGAALTAGNAEAAVVKGWSELHLYDCDLTGNMGDDLYNDSAWNVLVYKSGADSYEAEKSIFEMKDGTLHANNGGIFYTTNTKSVITLSNVKIVYPDVQEFFLKCTGNESRKDWGKAGENGADCLFTASDQDMEGEIIWDDISRLDFYMMENSELKGAVLRDKSYEGTEQKGYCHLYIEEGSTWTVTGDSTLTRLSCGGKIMDDEGNAVTVRGTDGTIYVQGSGKYTITVTYYEIAANMSGASEMSSWIDHQVAIPE